MNYSFVFITILIILSACKKNEDPNLLLKLDKYIIELEGMKEIIDKKKDDLFKIRSDEKNMLKILSVLEYNYPILERWFEKFFEKSDEMMNLLRENKNELNEETRIEYAKKALTLAEHIKESFKAVDNEYFYEDFFGKKQLKDLR